MKKLIRFVGLDVHAETIAVAVAEPDGTVRSLGRIPNRPEAVRKLLKRLGAAESLRVCYEAGPCGYVLYWQLTKLGVHCEVIAPTLIPTKAGDRVKTDRRDAEKLARCYRSGDLTAVWVPDAEHEALRDLVRAREAAKKDQLRVRNRLRKFLLRHGLQPASEMKAWSSQYRLWLQSLRFEHKALEATFLDYRAEVDHASERIDRLEKALDTAIDAAPAETRAIIDALQALRGVKKLTATTIVVEVGRLSRFAHPRQLMGYSGAVPSEHSSGGPDHTRRGRITKTGNAHLRRVLVEAAWTYQHRPNLYPALKKRQLGLSDTVREIAWKAQHRLHSRFTRLAARGKARPQVITAVARELLGFIWSIGIHTEEAYAEQPKRLIA